MGLKLNATNGGGSVELDVPDTVNDDVVLTLPNNDGLPDHVLATDGSGVLRWVDSITEVDQWYLTASHSTNDTLVDWARNNFDGAAANIGFGMSVASGVFTFPRNGKWLVVLTCNFTIAGDDSVSGFIQVTENDGTNWVTVAKIAEGNGGTNSRNGGSTNFYFLDVTDWTEVKVRFQASSLDSGSQITGDNSDFMRTNALFIRMGST